MRFFRQTKVVLLLAMLLVGASSFAQMLDPIHWQIRQEGKNVRISATIDEGWTLSILAIGEQEFEMFEEPEYVGTYSVTMPANDIKTIRYHVCDDKQCLAPTTYPTDEALASLKPKKAETVAKAEEPQVEETVAAEAEATDTVAESETADAEVEPEVAPEAEKADGEQSLWWIFLMGMVFGFAAIITPCVWPIIPMTVSFFIKRNGAARGTTNAHAIRDALMYGLSIVIIYVGLGLLITAVFGASALNAMSTNAVVNIIFFLVLVVFAASFFGAFEITLPSSWSTALSSKSSSTTGFISIMLMAFTLVIVSFSCTGPLIGTLLVEAAGRSLLAPAVGMLGFAIALALPFSLFAMFPQVLSKLPKSGGWMNTFKVTLAFLELALSLKFLSVADLAYGWHILDREVFVSLWIVIFALLGLYLLGIISFPHDDDDRQKTSVSRFFLAVISLSFAMYMVPGLWGAPLRAISAFAPPMSTQDWVMSQHAAASAEAEQVVFEDYDKGMAYAREHDMPVFVDFNGYGCVNCRKMEAAVLEKPEVAKHMQKYVLISLIVDDKTKLAEPIEVEENGKRIVLKTVGDKWSYKQRSEYGANAQPYYVQLDKNGQRIAETSYSYDEDIEKFLNWLVY